MASCTPVFFRVTSDVWGTPTGIPPRSRALLANTSLPSGSRALSRTCLTRLSPPTTSRLMLVCSTYWAQVIGHCAVHNIACSNSDMGGLLCAPFCAFAPGECSALCRMMVQPELFIGRKLGR